MNYWKEKFYLFLMASLVLAVLIFLFVEEKRNAPIVVGALLAASAFPLLKLKDLLYALAGNFSAFIGLFLGSTRSVFFLSLIIGILLAAAGIGLKLWMPETIKKKFSLKDVREIVKTEISKEKEEEQAQKQQIKKKVKK